MTKIFERFVPALAMTAVVTLTLAGRVAAQSAGQDGAKGTRGIPTVRAAPRIGEIEIDGLLEEPAWVNAAVATGFVQARPVEGAPAENDTEVRVLFDADDVYVGARMYDREPAMISDQLVRRDDEGQYDLIVVGFDPNLDQRTGYSFGVSAAGVQVDKYFYDDTGVDPAWDAVWESAVFQDSLGWTAEFRIPLSQMRFEPSDSPQVWGIQVRRVRVASNEETHLSLMSRLQEGLVSQFGRLENMRITEPSRHLELLPYFVFRGHAGPAEEADPFFDGWAADARVGADFKMGIGGNFTLDAAVNPDFGQVEADPAVINLTAFETFFEERRPFFVEDARNFDFGLSGSRSQLFHSRRIGAEPHGNERQGAAFSEVPDNTTVLGAAKVSGRTENGLSVGALGAVTGKEHGRAYFAEDRTNRKFLVEARAEYGVLRVQQDLHDGASQVGVLLAGMRRDLPGDGSFDNLTSEAFDGGIDFEFQWSDREWALTGFVTGSHVRGDSTAMIGLQRSSTHYFQRPDAKSVEMDSLATSMSGVEWRVEFSRRRGNWTGSIYTGEKTPGFEINDLGFRQIHEWMGGGGRVGYRDITPGEHLRSWNVNLSTFQDWSHDLLRTDVTSFRNWRDARVRGNVRVQGQVELLNYWRIDANVRYGLESMSRTATRGGPVMIVPAEVAAGIGFQTDPRKVLSFRPSFDLRNATMGSGSSYQFGVEVEVRPSSRLEIRVQPNLLSRTDPTQYVASVGVLHYEPTFGKRYLFGEIERREVAMQTRIDWTFSPTLTLQVFAQTLLASGDYIRYGQLAEPGTFRFDHFEEGEVLDDGGTRACVGGRTCETQDHIRHFDFDGDGISDYSFRDLDFTVRSLTGNAVLRWEFRPGSHIFLVWQRQQATREAVGSFSLGRDASRLLSGPAEDVFMLKADFWLDL